MADQFDVIESGRRGRRQWVGLIVVAVLVVVPVAGLVVSREPEPPVQPGAVPEPIRSMRTLNNAPNALYPKARVKGDDETVRVVFPDGTRGEVRYPAELGLDALGVRPFRGVWIDGAYRRLAAPYGGEVEVSKGGQPIRNLTPDVQLWPRQPGSGAFGQVLLFAFGPWRLALYDRFDGLTFEQRMAVAERLRGRVTKDGYLVLSGGGPVRLAEPGDYAQGDPVGPQLWFGSVVNDMVAVIPLPGCAKGSRVPEMMERAGRPAKAACRDGVQVAATGEREFVERAVKGIRITLK
ncbi:hypothetical protein FHU36_008313 [Nonomuraea muscovyensis]|uniref:Uncharacterized protein n=1 Tax=Nonomuraea muscovyensis TaxID=1124761 RepID=A0A7X0CAT2_9ACTN|nr:hypothetical protein [Nonomuraea muscovyensis]MBB6351730.1 hypothetical protein [Nonomuraea muscovyensis]